MYRRGSVRNTLVLIFSCLLVFGSAALAQTGGGSEVTWGPVLYVPGDTTIVWCEADSICFEVSGVDPDEADSLRLTLVSGPVAYPVQWFGHEFTTEVCFYPGESGVYTFIWELLDSQGHGVRDTTVFTLELGMPPVIEDQQFFTELCDLREDRLLPVVASPVGDLTFELVSGPGTIDPATGVITYRPDTSGTYMFEIAVSNVCGHDTATVTDQVILNLPPYCLPYDSTVYLCDPEEICFEVFAVDPEGDSIEISQVEGIGTFTQTSDTSGVTCFMPPAVDSATYSFIYRVADSCILSLGDVVQSTPACCVDTFHITVIITPPGELACPPDTTLKFCVPPGEMPQTICLPGFSSSWSTTTVSAGTLSGDTLCFEPEGFGDYTFTMIGSDTCGHADTCTTTVTVKGNNVPYVSTADDFSIDLCAPEEICFAATADDLDFDIVDISTNFGYYDNATDRVCFPVDTAGVYTLILTAVDECGATDSDTTVVTVGLTDPPSVDLGEDRQYSFCELEEICIDAIVTGSRFNYIGTSVGTYDSTTGQLCFTPDTSGSYIVTLEVHDDCDRVAADTVTIDVDLGSPPVITGLADTSLYLCFPQQVCLDVEITDPDDDITDITVTGGTYADGQVCFVPYDSGVYKIIVSAVDECGLSAIDTAIVTVRTDQEIILFEHQDTTVFLCDPDTLCFEIGENIPEDAEIVVGGIATFLRWYDDRPYICFFSDCCLENRLSVSVTTQCGTYSREFDVSVQTNSKPLVQLPRDTAVMLCEEQEICLPVGIDDIDGNIAGVDVEGGTYDDYNNTICFLPEGPGTYFLKVTVTDSCGAVRADSLNVTVNLNTAPYVSYTLEDSVFELCELEQICIPVQWGDEENNIVGITSSQGTITRTNPDDSYGNLCFTPESFGEHCITLTVADACGLVDTAEFCIQVDSLPTVSIHCPTNSGALRCDPGEVCIDMIIEGDPTQVTMSYGSYNLETGQVCFFADTAGRYDIQIIAEGPCNVDTCNGTFYVDLSGPPTIECPSDTSLFLCGPDTVALPIEMGGTGMNYQYFVTEPAYLDFTGGESVVKVPILEPGSQTIQIKVVNPPCDPDSCSFTVTAGFNSPPQITFEGDSLALCDLEEICIPFSVFDIDANLHPDGITSSLGVVIFDSQTGERVASAGLIEDNFSVHYEPEGPVTITGEVCFTPEAFGSYEITLTAVDDCEAEASRTVTVKVDELARTAITCPEPGGYFGICEPGEQAIPIPIVGANVTVTSSLGTYNYETGVLEFTLTDYGEYEITIIADGECNSDTCTFAVVFAEPAGVTCSVADTSFFLCYEVDSVMYMAVPVTVTGDSLDITVTPDMAYYEDGFAYVPVHSAGAYTVTVKAQNFCSMDSCSFDVDVLLNSPPEVEAGADVIETLCELEEICIPYSANDIDDNIFSISSSLGVVNGQQVCFTPETFGEFNIVITAVDDCGETDEDTVHISLTEGQYVSITCPEQPIFMNVDVPDTVRIPLPIDPVDADITVAPDGYYDAATQELVVYITTRGTYEYEIIADAECNSDTCVVQLNISEYVPPYVECIGSVDTALCLVEPQTLCTPVTFAGTDVQLEVSEPAYYLDGNVCLEVSEPGEYVIDMIAFNDKAADTCTSILVVTGGNPPNITMPETLTESLCEADSICFDVTIEDAEFDVTSVTVNQGVYDAEAGTICFFAETAGEYEIILTASDDCDNTAVDTTLVTVGMNEPPLVDLGDDLDVFSCDELGEICVDVTVTDDNDYTVSSNIGQYNESTGQVCFVPDIAGEYALIVEVTDICGARASDTVMIDISLNSPPEMTELRDTSVYICFPTEICLPVEITDVDDNLQSVQTSLGTYADGQVCFVPYDSGVYRIVVSAVDECGLSVVDTAVVTVRTDQEIVLYEHEDTTVFLCEPDTLCFQIGENIPPDAEIEVSGIATFLRWYDDQPYICFFSDCCLENSLSVSVTTQCGTYSREFDVSVQTNSKPLVLLPQDTTIVQCQLEEVCIPVGIDDIDGNVASISAVGGTYNGYRREVCFTPDAEGTYEIIVTAIDSCEAARVDTAYVTVQINEAPVITYQAIDTVYKQCAPEEICVPIGIDDVDGNITDITVEGGTYDAEAGTVCIVPGGTGTFCATVRVVDICGLTDQQEVCVEVELGDFVEIACPETPYEEIIICESGPVCVDLAVIGTGFTVTADYGTWENDSLCFQVDTSGTYVITVIAEAQCNSDTCVVTVPVTILDTLFITCRESAEEFLCNPDTLCYEFSFGPASAEVSVSAPAFISEGEVCVPVLAEGTQTITLIASNQCGADTCSLEVTADFNAAPMITTQNLELVECEFFEVCVPVTITDADNNITEISTSVGEFNADTTAVCFTPTEFGIHYVEISVTDACGVIKAKTATVSFTEGEYASIICPDATQFASVCGPDTICILAPVSPAGATVTVLPAGNYNPETGEVCLYVEEGGTIPVTVIAEAQCGSDTCEFNLEVDFGIPAQVICPDDVDTLLCLAQPDTLCLPVEVSGTGVQVNVNPIGYYSAGTVCLPISEAGEYNIEVIAFGTCGADTCDFTVTVTADQAPELVFPEELTFERCPDDIDEICIDGIFATDVESVANLTMTCGPGEFENITPDSGRICFVPETFGRIEFCFEADDGCNTVTGSYFVNIVARDDCDVCLRVSIDGGKCTPVGLRKQALVNIESNDRIGGFNLLISFDPSALSFQTATLEGGAAQDWEYFTWNLGGVSYGQIRFVGIADRNNGASHPPPDAYSPQGTLIFVDFIVANDQNLGDVFVPINFIWKDCDDNSFSDTSGTLLYVDSRIFNAEEELIWDEFDDVLYPESNRLPDIGAPDSCIVQDEKNQALRCIEFINGGICIIDPDSIDDRGDVNLNGLAYEIADAVVFTRYFIHDLAAFTINVAGQIAATDVNADGLTLTVSDLVLLIRVIVGDAAPIPKVTPYADKARIQADIVDGELKIVSETHETVGAAYFVFDLEGGLAFGQPEVTEASAEFKVIHSLRDGQLHLLMYDIGDGRIEGGLNELVNIPVYGEGRAVLVRSDLVDYTGRPYVSQNGISVPTEFTLNQNYPNPFNPTTTISFMLPKASAWNLRVYNVTGGLVREFSGHSGVGTVEVVWDGCNTAGQTAASGVYFYRLEASDFSQTRKMILLK